MSNGNFNMKISIKPLIEVPKASDRSANAVFLFATANSYSGNASYLNQNRINRSKNMYLPPNLKPYRTSLHCIFHKIEVFSSKITDYKIMNYYLFFFSNLKSNTTNIKVPKIDLFAIFTFFFKNIPLNYQVRKQNALLIINTM